MRITTTAILAGIVVILATIIHFVDRVSETPPGAGIGNMLARFDPMVIDEVIIKSSSGSVELERNKLGQWFFKAPITDRVDPTALAALLDQLNHLSILDEIKRTEIGGTDQISAADMGLDSSGLIRVEISNSNPEIDPDAKEFSTTLLIGKEAPLNNAVYARLPDTGEKTDGSVAVVDGNPRKFLTDPIGTLRDRLLIDAAPERLVKIVVKTATGNIPLLRKIVPPQVPWKLLEPTETLANATVMDELVSAIGAIQVLEVISDGEPDKIPNPVPDDSLVFELQFYGDKMPTLLLLKQHYKDGKLALSKNGAPILEASISNRPARYLVESTLLDNAPQTASAYRNLHLLKVQPLAQKRIIINSPTQPEVDLRSTPTESGLQWSVVINGQIEAAYQGAISNMVQAINDTEVLDFVSDSQARLPEFGLDQPAIRVTFQSYPREGQTEQDTIQVLQLGRKAGDETSLYANIIGRPYIYKVPADLQIAIPTHISNWKSRKLLSFNDFNVKEITRSRPDEPTIAMKYDLKTNKWSVTKDGDDVTNQLNEKIAKTMRTRLGSLSATSWAVSLGAPYQALETPSTTFKIKLLEFDPAIGEEKPVEHTLKFAPSNSEASYYGQIDDSPDVFHIDSKTYSELIRNLLMSRGSPGDR